MAETKQYTTPEQTAYAVILDWGMKVGFVILVATFLLYVLGIASPHIPVDDLPRYWTMPVGEYLKAADVHPGWTWLALVGKGDFMNFVGIAFLSAVTILCYARILPILVAARDNVYTAIAVLEILVLTLAASGILAAGH
jgi:hypothetical protein